MLSFVQIRVMRREGLWVFHRYRGVREAYAFMWQLYWRELTPIQRLLLWIGIGAFMVTVCVIGPLCTFFLHG
jgi:hypothetical protein